MSDAATPGHARPPRPLVERFVVRVIWIVLAIVAIAILWQGAIEAFKPPAYLIPTPFGVLQAFSEKQDTLVHHASYTFSSALLGLVVSSVFAISLAVLFVSFRMFAQASMPLVIAFRSMPAAAIAPLITLMVGRGVGTNIVVVVLVSFFPILALAFAVIGLVSRAYPNADEDLVTAINDSAITNQAHSWLASGVMGSENRKKP